MLDAKVVGSVLQRLREERGLSQEIVSGLAGIGRTHLSAIERGERKPTLETFYRIGEALHMRPSAVLAEIEREREAFLAAQQGNASEALFNAIEGNYADAVRLLTTAHSARFDGKATLFVAERTLQEGMSPERAWSPWIAELDIYRQDCAHVDIISPGAFEKIGPIIRATLNR